MLTLRRKGLRVAADARSLGSGQLTEHSLAEAARHVSLGPGVPEREPRSGSRRPTLVRARRLVCQVTAHGMGYSRAGVAQFLGVTTSAVNRLAVAERFSEVQ